MTCINVKYKGYTDLPVQYGSDHFPLLWQIDTLPEVIVNPGLHLYTALPRYCVVSRLTKAMLSGKAGDPQFITEKYM